MRISKRLQTGEKFGRLTVIKLDHIQEYISPNDVISNKEYYLCKCDCGNECIILKKSLKLGYTKSCGCFRKEIAKKEAEKIKHGLIKTRLYNIFSCIKTRCYNKKHNYFNNYGGRGITICDEWLNKKNGFITFYNWAMDNGYQENLTIDRIDNNGNYNPDNCRWIIHKEQCRNQSSNVNITYNGETHCIAEWAEILNIKSSFIYNRIHKNWSIEKIFAILVKKM